MTTDSSLLSTTLPTLNSPVATLLMLRSTLRCAAFCSTTIRIVSGWMFITSLLILCSGLRGFTRVIYMCRLSLRFFTIICALLMHILLMKCLAALLTYLLKVLKLIFCSDNAKSMMSTSPPVLFFITAPVSLFHLTFSLISSTLNKTHWFICTFSQYLITF